MATYDHFAERKVSWLGRVLATVFLRSLADRLPTSPSAILEVGTGDGVLARMILAQGHQYQGYEPAPVLAQRCRDAGLQVHEALVPPLLEADASQDLVYLIHLLEHMPDFPTAAALLRDCKRVLKVGGRLIVVAPDIAGFGAVFWDCDSTHVYPTGMRRVQQLLCDAQLRVTRRRYVYGSLGFWPGYFLWRFTQVVLALGDPLWNGSLAWGARADKLRTLFARSLWIEAENIPESP